MSDLYGKLYVVATPIGNLADISFRALDTLRQVDLIAAEDTRHVGLLLQHYGINNKVASFHQHNEDKMADNLIQKLRDGLSIALVSDAGTPLLSDPGMPLVRSAKEAGITVVPIPGACALITALSASGIAISQFSFEGFLPRTASARKAFFTEKLCVTTTWAFYESSHRILSTLEDMLSVIEPDRQIVIARELTKLHETIVKTTLSKAVELVRQDEYMRKGEFVVIVDGAAKISKEAALLSPEHTKVLSILMQKCTTKTAVELAVEITGARKKLLYQAALDLEKGA
ncbi:MAG: 16S rRNA (cytidine(1402)-2'-O)-methyltransferase [Methylococcaceae bacterium]|nr:16S rRNA (cytidine(1402)-2'-O)-methyltransferase [Methylococcaceae bacterium]